MASTIRLTITVANLATRCNLDARPCSEHNIITVFDSDGRTWGTVCRACGNAVDLRTWSTNMYTGSRPWSRQRRAT